MHQIPSLQKKWDISKERFELFQPGKCPAFSFARGKLRVPSANGGQTGPGLNLNQPFVLENDRTGVAAELKRLFDVVSSLEYTASF